MIRRLLIAALVAVTVGLAVAPVGAYAQMIPAQHEQAIAVNEPGATFWPVPALNNGPLLSLFVRGITNSATVAVSHLQRIGSGGFITNTVETALAGDTLTFYAAGYAPAETHTYGITNGVTGTYAVAAVKPVWLIPGDYLSFTLSASNSPATAVIRSGIPGN